MADEADKVVWIVTGGDEDDGDEATTGERGGWGDRGGGFGSRLRGRRRDRRKPVPFAELKRNMGEFLQTLGELFGQAAAVESAGMELNEIELSVEINGKGQIGIVGIGGAEMGSTGAIVLKFQRKQSG